MERINSNLAYNHYKSLINKIEKGYVYLYDANMDDDVKGLLIESLKNQEVYIKHQMSLIDSKEII